VAEILKGIQPAFCWFEDFQTGQVFEYGSWLMTKKDMVGYALMYDPEPFHVDKAAAIKLGWDDIIASGPQLVSICRRLQKDGFPNAEIVISPGWDEIRWTRPVFAGDTISSQTEVLSTRPLNSRPGEGAVAMLNKLFNQKGELVAHMTSNWFVRCR